MGKGQRKTGSFASKRRMSGELLTTCAANCDTTHIAWEYLIDHQGMVAWIIGGVFALGNFTGWLLTTMRNIEKRLDSPQPFNIPQPVVDYRTRTSDLALQPQFTTNSSSSDTKTTDLRVPSIYRKKTWSQSGSQAQTDQDS